MRRNLLCLAALALMLLTATGCVKNGLIAKEETINEKWAEIDNMLKSRNDKLPALVAAAKKPDYRASAASIYDSIIAFAKLFWI